MKDNYFKNLQKAKQEFISKRCDEVSKGEEPKASFKILQELMEKLGYEEKNLFMQYTEATNVENFQLEEKIYSLGFADGVSISLSKFEK